MPCQVCWEASAAPPVPSPASPPAATCRPGPALPPPLQHQICQQGWLASCYFACSYILYAPGPRGPEARDHDRGSRGQWPAASPAPPGRLPPQPELITWAAAGTVHIINIARQHVTIGHLSTNCAMVHIASF